MGIFVRLVTASTGTGHFDGKKDTDVINQVLVKLQQNGAKILSITPALGGGGTVDVAAVYVITYEAPAPITVNI